MVRSYHSAERIGNEKSADYPIAILLLGEIFTNAEQLKLLPGKTKIVMEYTGAYYEPISDALHNKGIFVCAVINPLLIDDCGTNRVRKVKTDKKEAFKPAKFAEKTCAISYEYMLLTFFLFSAVILLYRII